jgi:hypothetical protein
MIKFFKGELSGVSGQIDVNKPNNIVFVTDRNTLYMGGAEYGKDQFSAVASGDLATTSAKVSVGTVIFDKDNGILYQKTGAETLTTIQNVPQNLADLKEALSATISTAFDEGKVTIGTTTGVTASDFVLDTTSGDLASVATPLSTTLVNAATLSAAIDDINQANAVLSAGNGIGINEGAEAAGGKVWTVSTALGTANTNTLGFTEDGLLTDNITLSALGADGSYAARYALVNTRNNQQLGDYININKNQLLKSAAYVTGTYSDNTFTSGTGADKDRFLQLVWWTDADGDGTEDGGEVTSTYINVNELFDSYTSGNGITVDPATNTIAINIDSASEDFLLVDSDGLKVTGIQTAIDSAINGLGSDAGTANQYVTAIGVTAEGALSAATAQVSAAQIAFDNNGITTISSTTVQAAIAELAEDLGAGIDSLDVEQIGDSTTYIQYISETDGKISAQSATLDAEKVAYSTTFGGDNLTNVSGALKKIEGVISGMDLDTTSAGTAPSAGTANALKVINTVGEIDGKVSATPIDLTAANTYTSGVTAVTSGSTATVGVTQGSAQAAFEDLAAKIADFGSFHDGSGNIIA